MTAVENAIAEIDGLLTVFAPQHAGLLSDSRIGLQDTTEEFVRKDIVRYDRRIALLYVARAALVALMSDGHPDIPIMPIDESAFADLKANAAYIEAALLRFSSNAAVSVNMAGGVVEPK